MKSFLLQKLAAILMVLLTSLNANAGNGSLTKNSVSLSSFTITINSVSAVRNRDKTVSVNWVVDREIGTRQYELERSSDGHKFSTVEINLNTTNDGERNVYDQIDWYPLLEETYYRIKAVSLTGKVSYSAIVKVGLAKVTSPVNVYPNPVVNKTLHVHFTNLTEGMYKLVLFNKLGQALWNSSVAVDNSIDVKTFPLGQNVAAGSYQLMVIAPGEQKSVQQIVIN